MSRLPFHLRIARAFEQGANRIASAWYRLIGPIERAFGRLGESLMGALDSFEGLESFVVGIVRVLFSPLILAGRLIARLLPEKTGAASAPRKLASGLFGLAERLNLDGVLIALAKLTKPLWWPVASLLGFVNAWLATRRTRELALAAPALLLAAPFAYVAAQGALLGKADVAERYKIAVREATDASDYQLVQLYERKLAQLGIDTRRGEYRTAMAIADGGDLAGAYERMRRLAPEDRPGYPSAHIWIVQRLLSGDLTTEQEPRLEDDPSMAAQLAQTHLDRLADLEVEGAGVAQLRAFALASLGKSHEAAETLAPYSTSSLNAAALRMRVLSNAREREAAREQARAYLALRREARGEDLSQMSDFTAWALAADLLRDSREMELALDAWHAADPENDKPRTLLALYRREQSVRLLNDPTASPERTAEVLIEAVRLGSPNDWIAAQADRIVAGRRQRSSVDAVWRRLTEGSQTPDEWLGALATSAAGAGEIADARAVYAGLAESPDVPAVVLNNYAWTLLQPPDPDPAAALEAVQAALAKRPNDHRFRETRGQVLIALGRWEDAVADLEYALNGLPDSPEVHQSLATAYDAMAKPQLAKIHRQRADR